MTTVCTQPLRSLKGPTLQYQRIVANEWTRFYKEKADTFADHFNNVLQPAYTAPAFNDNAVNLGVVEVKVEITKLNKSKDLWYDLITGQVLKKLLPNSASVVTIFSKRI